MNKKQRGILLAITFLIAVSVLLYFVLQLNFGYLIERTLTKQSITIESSGAEFDLWTRSISFDRIKLTLPDWGTVTCTDLKVNRIRVAKLLLSIDYNAGEVSLDSLILDINTQKPINDSVTQSSKVKTKRLIIDKLLVRHGQVSLLNKDNHIQGCFNTQDLSIDTKNGINFGIVSVHKFSMETFSQANILKIDTIKCDIKNKTLQGIGISHKTSLRMASYIKKFPFQKNKIRMQISQITALGIDANSFRSGKGFQIEKIEISALNLNVSKDKTLPKKITPNKALLIDIFELSQVPFTIDTLTLLNSNITYEQRFPNNKIGVVTFDRLYASIYNISTAKGSTIILDAQCRFQHQGKLKSHFEFNPSPHPNLVVGELSEMDMTAINQMTIPSGISIESGQIVDLTFDFSYTDKLSTGTIDMQYQDLSIKLVDDNTDRPGLLELESLLANAFVIRSQNIEGKSKYRQGKIKIERDPTKQDVTFWWQSILDGIKSTVGIKKKERK
ncbi:MAG: DUF748 domain-containing protein [Reichenbachiella sp.]